MTDVSYDDLVDAATVGVSRRPLSIDALAGPAVAHADSLNGSDPAAAVLDAAALMVAARRAGTRPVTGVTCPSPAAEDTAPELPPRAADLLDRVQVGDAVLVSDLLTAAGSRGYRAPAALLPVLLDAAVKTVALRPVVAAMLGARGRWLAGQRADWLRVANAAAPGVPDNPNVWDTGSRGERRGYLAQLRERDPAAARDLLAASWPRETGEERADLLAILAHGLSAADEEFLEAALDDRKDSVRVAARQLLARLPGSAFNRRAAQRAASVLRLERHGLRRLLVAVLPDLRPDAAAIRDGITVRSPAVTVIGTGPWLLTQMIAAAPLGGWVTSFGLDPCRLVSLPVAGGLRDDVHAGWRLAAISQASSPWAEALLATREPGQARGRPPAAWLPDHQVAAVLPANARAARAADLLTEAPNAPATVTEVISCPSPWPGRLAATVVAALHSAVTPGREGHWPVALVTAAARGLPATGPDDYAAALAQLAAAESCPPALSARLRSAADTIALRRSFLEEIT